MGDEVDPETRLPVVSLYGPRFAPGRCELEGLDLVLFDLQDVGVRFYTFLWTLSHLMQGCARAGVPLRILDRPNPLGGIRDMVEGPILDQSTHPSLLGRWPIPIRHSLTMGELALLLRAEMGLEMDLKVVAMEGWRREMLWTDTGLPFCPPSPGLPDFSSVLLYPGLALLEATNLSEGRGTTLAFRWCGAPWVDGERLSGLLNEVGLPGVFARAESLDLEAGNRSACPGVVFEVTDPAVHRPVALGLRLLTLLRTLWPAEFSWQRYPTAANPAGDDHLLRLLGSTKLTRAVEGDPRQLTDDLIGASTRAEGWWRRAEPHLLYS